MKKTLYELLEIQENATQDEIRKAFRQLAIKYHPDKNLDNQSAAEEKFKEIHAAYQILSDTEKKAKYDQILKNNRNNEQRKKDEQKEHFKQTRTNQKSTTNYGTNKKNNWGDVVLASITIAALLLILMDDE